MVIITLWSFPPESAKEIGKSVLELPPLPAYMTMKDYVNNEVGVGIKVITIYEIDQSKIREALEVLNNRYVIFFGVPGFTYSIQVWLETMEALKLVGIG
jgi:hypothetical protein